MTDARLIVFDVDGTLIDSQHLIHAAMVAAFDAAGHPCPEREAVLAIVGLSLNEAMAALAPHLAPSETLALAGHYLGGLVTREGGGGYGDAPLYPGALGALERLASDPFIRLGVATGKGRGGLDQVFAAHDLARFFVTAQTADLHPSKPHPSMLLAALAETGCAPERSVMVGDTEFDMAMGRAAGFGTIGVAWGYHPRARLEAGGADLVIDGFDGLEPALLELAGRHA